MECDCCGRRNAEGEPYAGWLVEYFEPYYRGICSPCGQMLEAEAHDVLEEFAQRMYYGQKTNKLVAAYLQGKLEAMRTKSPDDSGPPGDDVKA